MSSPSRSSETDAVSPAAWAVAVLTVPTDAGTRALVDVADPARVLKVSENGALRDPRPDEEQLPDALARYALTLGVQRWSQQPLDESLIAVDVALAAGTAGLTAAAVGGLQATAWEVLDLANQVVGGAPGPLTIAVAEAVAATVDAVPEIHPARAALADLNERLNGTPDDMAESVDWDETLALLRELDPRLVTATSGVGALAAGLLGSETTSTTSDPRLIDIRLLPARILAMPLTVGYTGVQLSVEQTNLDTVTVRGLLAASIANDDPRLSGLMVRAIEASTGELVAAAPAVADVGQLVLSGELTIGDRSPDSLAFDFFHISNRVPSRFGTRRTPLLRVDGHAVHGWTLARASAAAAVFPDTADAVDQWEGGAVHAVSAAADDAAEATAGEEGARRRPRLRSYSDAVSGLIAEPDLVRRPLLSEMAQLFVDGRGSAGA